MTRVFLVALVAISFTAAGCNNEQAEQLQAKNAGLTARLTRADNQIKVLKAENQKLKQAIEQLQARLADAGIPTDGSAKPSDAGSSLLSKLLGVKRTKSAPQPKSNAPQRRVVNVYYYDLDKGELFTGPGNQLPPIATPTGGKTGVRAYIFACGDCSDESKRFVGYYEMFTPEFHKALEAPLNEKSYLDESFGKGRLISTDGKNWVDASTPEGIKISHEISTKCPAGVRLRPCYPPQGDFVK